MLCYNICHTFHPFRQQIAFSQQIISLAFHMIDIHTRNRIGEREMGIWCIVLEHTGIVTSIYFMNIPISIHGLVRAEQRNITGTLTIRQRIKKTQIFRWIRKSNSFIDFFHASLSLSLSFPLPLFDDCAFFSCVNERLPLYCIHAPNSVATMTKYPKKPIDTHTHRTEIFLYVSAFSWSP